MNTNVLQNEELLNLFSSLNYKHQMLFGKLSEAETRLRNIAYSLGGEFISVDKSIVTKNDSNHLDAYDVLLEETTIQLELIFNTLQRLEYLCGGKVLEIRYEKENH